MFLTLFYMYATLMQWWRLNALKLKLNGTLTKQNALVLLNHRRQIDLKKRCFENLLFDCGDGRLACTLVPRQTLNLSNWAQFPNDPRLFPIHLRCIKRRTYELQRFYILIQAKLDSFAIKKRAELIEVENYGDLIAWRALDQFEVIIKSDLDHLTRLMSCFSTMLIDINHELHLNKIEVIDVEGNPTKIEYSTKFPSNQRLKYHHTLDQWQKFVESVRNLYSKVNEINHPKIMIENNGSDKPISEVKPIKKTKNALLDVHHAHTMNKNAKQRSKNDVKTTATSETSSKPPKPTKVKAEKSAKTTTSSSKPPSAAAPPPLPDVKKERKSVSAASAKSGADAPSHQSSSSGGGKNLQRQNATSSTSPNRTTKPPNILVYADSQVAKENVKSVLKTIINTDRYTIYDLPVATSTTTTTTSSKANTMSIDNATTRLVIVCGGVREELIKQLLEYLLTGGQMLCLCSDFLHSVLQTFTTAEVREHELVRFTYGEWKRVRMMHHIFCYQASPAKKQFSKDSDQSNHSSSGSSPVAPRTPSTVDIQHNGRNYTIQVQVLGAEETWQTPSLLLATVRNGAGKAIFSQVHLEIDPTQYQDDENKYTALKESDTARLEILQHILANQLTIDCSPTKHVYTPAYFLGRHDLKLELLNKSDAISENRLQCDDNLEVIFCGKDVQPGDASALRLPVLILTCPQNFSTVSYFETLCTSRIGRLVIYADTLTSTQLVVRNRRLIDGLVVIARQQSAGHGRAQNVWLSPDGCAMFSLQMHIALDSNLGRRLSLAQHLVMCAIVSAIKQLPGLDNLDVGIKWPNDLYAYSNMKIGGLIINSLVQEGSAVVNIGCGLNLNNSEPTISLNEMISKHLGCNDRNIPYEKFFAYVFNELERILNKVQSDTNLDYLFELYYKYWLHTDAKIVVNTANNDEKRNVRIVGIDDYGYLLVKDDKTNVTSSVQPDGNSFDMLRGLIAPKIT